MFTSFIVATSAQQSPFLNSQATHQPTPKMSVFAAPYSSLFSTQSYSRAPGTKPEHDDPSTTFIPASLSKLSLSLSEPIRRYFTSSNTSVVSDPSLHISETDDESSASLSSVSIDTSRNTIEQERELEPVLPLPTYAPIRNAPKPNAPPSYEASISSSELRRTQTQAVREEGVSFMSSYALDADTGYHSGHVGESWVGSKNEVERAAIEDSEKDDDGSCWCTQWWVVAGATSMPWFAYYVY